MDLRQRAKALKREIPAVCLAMRRRETPLAAQILAGIAVAYALSPVDLIPDFVPVLGYLDDVLLLPVLAAAAVRMIPPEVMSQCRIEAEGMWAEGRPKKWYFALPVAAVWVLVLWALLKCILK